MHARKSMTRPNRMLTDPLLQKATFACCKLTSPPCTRMKELFCQLFTLPCATMNWLLFVSIRMFRVCYRTPHYDTVSIFKLVA